MPDDLGQFFPLLAGSRAASPGRRVLAVVMDMIFGGVFFGVFFALGALLGEGIVSEFDLGLLGIFPGNMIAGYAAGMIGFLIYGILAWIMQGRTGRSPGKVVAKTRVVREENGEAPGFGTALGRYLILLLSSIPFHIGLIVGAIQMIMDGRTRRTWWDKLLAVVVIDTGAGIDPLDRRSREEGYALGWAAGPGQPGPALPGWADAGSQQWTPGDYRGSSAPSAPVAHDGVQGQQMWGIDSTQQMQESAAPQQVSPPQDLQSASAIESPADGSPVAWWNTDQDFLGNSDPADPANLPSPADPVNHPQVAPTWSQTLMGSVPAPDGRDDVVFEHSVPSWDDLERAAEPDAPQGDWQGGPEHPQASSTSATSACETAEVAASDPVQDMQPTVQISPEILGPYFRTGAGPADATASIPAVRPGLNEPTGPVLSSAEPAGPVLPMTGDESELHEPASPQGAVADQASPDAASVPAPQPAQASRPAAHASAPAHVGPAPASFANASSRAAQEASDQAHRPLSEPGPATPAVSGTPSADPGYLILRFDAGDARLVPACGVIGRAPQADPSRSEQPIIISDPDRSTSKTHLHYRLQDGVILVEDAGSANGTRVPTVSGTALLTPGVSVRVPLYAQIVIGERSLSFEPAPGPQ